MKSGVDSSFEQNADSNSAKIGEPQEFLQDPQSQHVPEESKIEEEAKVSPTLTMKDDSIAYFGTSKTLRTPAHQKMIFKFV